MANFGSLGIGSALNGSLNVGLDTANKFAEYQKARYLDSSDQINKLSANQADIWGNHNREMTNASMSPELANLLQTAPRTEVQQAQGLQGALVQGNAEQQAVNGAVIGNALNSSVYQQQPYAPTLSPQPMTVPTQQPMDVEAMRREYLTQMGLTGGNIQSSLGSVLNGY